MNAEETPQSNSTVDGEDDSGLVTESLLSFAKDVRYVQAIQSLLAQATEPLLSDSLTPSTLTKGTWYTSCLFYVLMMVGRHGRTLGMKATGLQFASNESYSKHRLIGALLTLGAATVAPDLWASKDDRHAESQSEALRGNERQMRHEMLRQQMFQRASGSSQSTLIDNNLNRRQSSSETLSYRDQITIKAREIIKSLIRSLGNSTRDGPHNLPTRSDGSPRVASLATWIFRLHLAQFLITGKFPTMFHRLLGLQHQRESTSRVPVQPSTHRMVALLIGIQGSASLVRFCLKWWTDRLARYLEATRRASSTSKNGALKVTKQISEQYPIQSTCAICRTTRSHPAASSNCGHVFCWACLNHWVSSVKEACPYCRAPCRLEDIQPLYNYDHSQSLKRNEKDKAV